MLKLWLGAQPLGVWQRKALQKSHSMLGCFSQIRQPLACLVVNGGQHPLLCHLQQTCEIRSCHCYASRPRSSHAAEVPGVFGSIVTGGCKCMPMPMQSAAKFDQSRCLFNCARCSAVHSFITCPAENSLHVVHDALCQMHTHTDVVQSLLLGCSD